MNTFVVGFFFCCFFFFFFFFCFFFFFFFLCVFELCQIFAIRSRYVTSVHYSVKAPLKGNTRLVKNVFEVKEFDSSGILM